MSKNTYLNIFLGLLSVVIVFHICIMIKWIPYNIAWGGRIQNDIEMYAFETVSLIINLFLGFILLMKGRYIRFQFREKVVNTVLWSFFGIFILNTAGNIFAKTSFEKSLAALTLFCAWLIWKILRSGSAQVASSGPMPDD